MDRTEYMREYRRNNQQRIKELQAGYYANNKESLLEGFKEYYQKNRTKRRELGKQHYEQNKALYLAYSRTRKSILKRSTPVWLDQGMFMEIVSIYEQCKAITQRTGIQHHVDHIVPLNGKDVSGLHVPWNLQIITAQENLKKSNKHEQSSIFSCIKSTRTVLNQ